MRSNGHSTLRIYVARHCTSCAEALRLAEEIRRRFAGIDLELIDLDAEGSLNVDDVFSVPTYVLDGRTISLGNPAPDQLFTRLAEALGRSQVTGKTDRPFVGRMHGAEET